MLADTRTTKLNWPVRERCCYIGHGSGSIGVFVSVTRWADGPITVNKRTWNNFLTLSLSVTEEYDSATSDSVLTVNELADEGNVFGIGYRSSYRVTYAC